ncbi:MAG: ThuA domain-containing protein [Verrucomicrobiales bacterium]
MGRALIICLLVILLPGIPASLAQKKIVVLAGDLDSHPPGTHEYEKSALLVEHCLETSSSLDPKPRVEVHFHGWPKDEKTLDDADTIMVISGGSDRRELDHPLMVGERMSVLGKQMARGCGLVTFHWATFSPLRVKAQMLDWVGGFFDYESGPDVAGRRWLSSIETKTWNCRPATPRHPITRGVGRFSLKEEFYYRMRFGGNDGRWKPIVTVGEGNDSGSVVGWCVERADGGRGFGFTGGHFYANWEVADFRKLVLNAIAWTAKIEVPEGGIESKTKPIAETRGAEVWKRRAPLEPSNWPQASHPVNRERIYDFYAKEADYFAQRADLLDLLLPEYPGLDGGIEGHWGNQNEATWSDGRWKLTDHGSVVCNVFRGANMTIPKAVCVRLGGSAKLATVFNPQTLTFDVVWRGGFVKFSDVRHGFMDGARLDGTVVTASRSTRPPLPFVYHGFYRHGERVTFAYKVGETELLDSASEENGDFVRTVVRAGEKPLAGLVTGAPAQWPQVIETKGELGGGGGPYVIDTLTLPFENPWRSLFFIGDHDFFANGDAAVCTMNGEVWTVSGIDEKLERLRWRRFATGLHQPLGLRIVDDKVHVLGRDQITRLHDLNADGEADFYECASNAFETSPGGHDFITGLERDKDGAWYFASGNQGLCRLVPGASKPEVLATGFRNPDGLALGPDGMITTSGQEGEWSPASAVFAVKKGAHFGYGGPKNNRPPDPPLVYLPRGIDNSTGGQVFVEGDRWGPLRGQLVGFSFGAGTHYLILRETIDGVTQGAAVPLAGEFRSGAHRGRFHPRDGQLYVSGMAGWGTYTPDDGCFQRVRYTGADVLMPVGWHARDNGVLLTFSQSLDRSAAGNAKSHFAQMWNYRYGPGYGSPEFSVRWPDAVGHDPLEVRSSHVLPDGRTLFLEIPQIRPANQVHLRVRPGGSSAFDIFCTIQRLGPAFADFPGYQAVAKTATRSAPLVASPPMSKRNPWGNGIPGRAIRLEAGSALQFAPKRFAARRGERLSLTFDNPDVVPHNFVLLKRGSLQRVGERINQLIAEPGAAAEHYVPAMDDVLVFTDMTNPLQSFTIHFNAPAESGDYPFLCSFPGHWQIMNGIMSVE